jgi:DnaK suppressor protein
MTGVSEKRKNTLRELLNAKKQEILGDIRKSMESSRDEDVRLGFEVAQDNADRSVEDLNRHIAASLRGAKSEMLDSIDEALARLEDGTYGTCEDCGNEIPLERMNILPFASCCVACQEVIDKQKKEEDVREKETGRAPEPRHYLSEEE